MNTLGQLLRADGSRALVLLRAAVGAIFISEGLQKFLFPAALGVGRFAKLGLPAPPLLAPFVGVVEVTCGGLVLLGLLTRLAAVPLICVMVVAIATTKVPQLLRDGFWPAAHDGRTDFAMILSCLCLVFVGGGPWSLDTRVVRWLDHARQDRRPRI